MIELDKSYRNILFEQDDKIAYVIGCDRDGRVRATAAGGIVEADLRRMLEVIEPRPGSP